MAKKRNSYCKKLKRQTVFYESKRQSSDAMMVFEGRVIRHETVPPPGACTHLRVTVDPKERLMEIGRVCIHHIQRTRAIRHNHIVTKPSLAVNRTAEVELECNVTLSFSSLPLPPQEHRCLPAIPSLLPRVFPILSLLSVACGLHRLLLCRHQFTCFGDHPLLKT
ncbi:hypothetical protein RRG08_048299 [Elysia crispata]|uniref:Uncharacterized protein n=1 Tax=Elysia crispata TaxID=231223 RepID=A0AAE0ZT24_9GAST|nr:hypothetical protein RRG08_048299 [Elysia crispata]